MEIKDSPVPSVPCLRVTQLDADDLDKYIVELLFKNQVDRSIKLLLKYASRVKPELRTALYCALLHFTVGRLHQTVGQKLFGVMFAESQNLAVASKRKIWALMGLEVFSYWWQARYDDIHPTFQSLMPGIAKLMDAVMGARKLFELLNFAMFLKNGKFSQLLCCILSLRVAFDHPNPMPGSISYALLGREILWKGLAEIFVYFLSLLDSAYLKKHVMQYFRASHEEPTGSNIKTCPVCGEWITQPYEVDCGHVFCYYCILAETASQATCPCCNLPIVKGLVPSKVRRNSDKVK